MTLAQWAEARATALVARVWPDFVGIHMVWGAINELTTLVGYQRLATLAAHPVLTELLARIIRDESRHFAFYYSQATGWLARSGTARLGRFLVDHFWAPVGSGVQPAAETRFLARYLFAGEKGWEASRRVDATIRRLPGFEDVALLEAWVGRAAREPIAAPGRVPSAMAHDGRHRGVYASARMSAAPRSSSGGTTSASADGSAKIARSTPSPEFCLSASSSIGAP